MHSCLHRSCCARTCWKRGCCGQSLSLSFGWGLKHWFPSLFVSLWSPSREYPYPMMCAFCYFKCVATCPLKGLSFSRRACWCQWLTVISAGGLVPSTPEISALQGNLPFLDLLSAYLKYASLHAWSVCDTPLPNEFIMTSEIAGVAGRWALIVFHWLLCSVVRDYVCCAMGRCMLWTV